ncbi:MAG: HTH-type transcriptional repressor NicR [Pseudomonadota bacterium]
MKNYYERQFENEEFLLFRLSSVSRRVANACAEVYLTEFGITVPEWRLMAQIGRFGSISAKDIAEKISMDRVAISRAAAKCLEEVLICEAPHQADRRSKVLSFTPKGKALYNKIIPRACELANVVESGLTKSEARTLKALLEKVDASVVKIMPVLVREEDAA